GFFNFRRAADRWVCDQTVALRNPTNDIWPLFTANGATKKVRTDRQDPMNITNQTVTIVNDLPQSFYDGRGRFVLNHGTYDHVKNGTVLAQYDCHQGTRSAVLVKVNIPAEAAVTVDISRNDTKPGE